MNFAPASTAMSRFVVETMPPSTARARARGRGVDHRQRGRGADGGGDRDVVPALGAEHDPLAGVEVGRGQVELALQQPEVVGAAVAGAPRAGSPRRPRRCRARRQRVAEREHEVDAPSEPSDARDVRGDAERVQRQLERLQRELALVEAQQHLAVERRKRVRHLVVDRRASSARA
jgi:hypothetical protein